MQAMLQRKIQKILGIESDDETEFGAFVFTLRPASSHASRSENSAVWHIAALNQSVPRVSLPHTGRRSLITTIILQASERESE
jgi:hypothetical protein